MQEIQELGEIQRVAPTHESFEHFVHALPFWKFAGELEEAREHHRAAELARRDIVGYAVTVRVSAGDAQVHPAEPHHGFEIGNEPVIGFVMSARLELGEVNQARLSK